MVIIDRAIVEHRATLVEENVHVESLADSRGPGRVSCPQTSDEILFCSVKHILRQIGQLLRLCKCKKAFSLKGLYP